LFPIFMFCTPVPFSAVQWTRFNVLRCRTSFGLYRGRQIPFSCFALPGSFLAILRAPGPSFRFCAPILIFGVAVGAGSHCHVLRSQSHFGWYRGYRKCRFLFSCFTLRTRFGRYRGRRVLFLFFALLDSFWVIPRASSPIFMFFAPVLILGGIEGAEFSFHVSRFRTRFRRYRGRGSHFHVLRSQTHFGQ
jgi:hypothetical protein